MDWSIGGAFLFKHLDAVAHLRQQLLHGVFQVHQGLLGILVGAGLDVFGFHAGLFDDLLRAALGILEQALPFRPGRWLFAGQLQGPVGFFLGLGHDPVFFRKDLLRLFHFLRDGDAHLVNDVQELVLIHDDIVRQRDGAAVIEEFFQAVN